MKITCLVDNTAQRASSFWGEHGLAFLVETESDNGGVRILFDTGQSGTVLLHNMDALKVKPRDLDALALSHAHYDHTGGLAALLERAPGLPLFAHPDLFRPRYSRRAGQVKTIGLGLSQEELAGRVELRLSAEPTEMAPGVWTTGEIAPRPEPEGRSPHHLVRADDGDNWLPDPYRDDLTLALETASGWVVLCGCGHAGLLNILAHVRRTFGANPVAVAGGTHLVNADEAQLEHVVAELSAYGNPRLYPNHCTGERAYVALVQAFGKRVEPCPAGMVLKF
jgi:7,8-dihydropterin-6-yl-methyl-4-(beta-D-ribofuranosyl)aminobenzene 5'-phosphate synthase